MSVPHQKSAQAQFLLGRAEMSQERLERYARALAEDMGLMPDMAVSRGPLKNLQRIFDKANGRLGGDITQVKDIARARILFETPEQMLKAREMLTSPQAPFHKLWSKRGVEVVEFSDHYLDPKSHGYIGAHLTVKVDLGKGRQGFYEIQFMHKDMQLTDMKTHQMYEHLRRIEENAVAMGRPLSHVERNRMDNLKQQITQMYQDDAKKYGLVSLQRKPDPYAYKREGGFSPG